MYHFTSLLPSILAQFDHLELSHRISSTYKFTREVANVYQSIQESHIAFCFVLVWNMVFEIEGWQQADDFRE